MSEVTHYLYVVNHNNQNGEVVHALPLTDEEDYWTCDSPEVDAVLKKLGFIRQCCDVSISKEVVKLNRKEAGL